MRPVDVDGQFCKTLTAMHWGGAERLPCSLGVTVAQPRRGHRWASGTSDSDTVIPPEWQDVHVRDDMHNERVGDRTCGVRRWARAGHPGGVRSDLVRRDDLFFEDKAAGNGEANVVLHGLAPAAWGPA